MLKTKVMIEVIVEHQFPGRAFGIVKDMLWFPAIKGVTLIEESAVTDGTPE